MHWRAADSSHIKEAVIGWLRLSPGGMVKGSSVPQLTIINVGDQLNGCPRLSALFPGARLTRLVLDSTCSVLLEHHWCMHGPPHLVSRVKRSEGRYSPA